MSDTITLYRPVGSAELALIARAGFSAFPPRLPDQPIFYPVTNEAYAVEIARGWNTKVGDKLGFVTRFEVEADYLAQFDRKIVGGSRHEEFWIPAEALTAFNTAIVGKIDVIRTFTEQDRLTYERETQNHAA